MGNARGVTGIIEKVCNVYAPNGKITLEVAKQVVEVMGLFPGGLNKRDIQTLLFVGSSDKGKQVAEISANCGGEAVKDTSLRLQWLAGLGYISTHAGKKILTAQGAEYLGKFSCKNLRLAAVFQSILNAYVQIIVFIGCYGDLL